MNLLSLSGRLLQHSSFLSVSRFVVVGLVNVVEGLVGMLSCLLGEFGSLLKILSLFEGHFLSCTVLFGSGSLSGGGLGSKFSSDLFVESFSLQLLLFSLFLGLQLSGFSFSNGRYSFVLGSLNSGSSFLGSGGRRNVHLGKSFGGSSLSSDDLFSMRDVLHCVFGGFVHLFVSVFNDTMGGLTSLSSLNSGLDGMMDSLLGG